MKHYNLEFGTRREIRQHIEHASKKLGISLQQHTIENLITDRITAITTEIATGKSKVINWENIVSEAAEQEQLDRDNWETLAPGFIDYNDK